MKVRVSKKVPKKVSKVEKRKPIVKKRRTVFSKAVGIPGGIIHALENTATDATERTFSAVSAIRRELDEIKVHIHHSKKSTGRIKKKPASKGTRAKSSSLKGKKSTELLKTKKTGKIQAHAGLDKEKCVFPKIEAEVELLSREELKIDLEEKIKILENLQRKLMSSVLTSHDVLAKFSKKRFDLKEGDSVESLSAERDKLTNMISLTKIKYYKRQIDSPTFNKLNSEHLSRLIEVESRMKLLKKGSPEKKQGYASEQKNIVTADLKTSEVKAIAKKISENSEKDTMSLSDSIDELKQVILSKKETDADEQKKQKINSSGDVQVVSETAAVLSGSTQKGKIPYDRKGFQMPSIANLPTEVVEKSMFIESTSPLRKLEKKSAVKEKLIGKAKFDKKYPIKKEGVSVRVYWDEKEKSSKYMVSEPELSPEEKPILNSLKEEVMDVVQSDLYSLESQNKAKDYLNEKIDRACQSLNIKNKLSIKKYRYYILRDFVGYGKIDPIMNDPNIEDLGCDGFNIPVYLRHRKYGALKTNIAFEKKELKSFVVRLSQRANKFISFAQPLMDGSLPDGSRVQATFGGDVSPKGPSFSIRKFKENPVSPVELILNGTLSEGMMAFFWLSIEYGLSVIIAGGTATGKTTLLNAISLFIPPDFKIVSIEDTPELNIPHDNWIQSVSRIGYGPSSLSGERYGEVTMFDLLRAAFRQRPDYVLVGEVRGKEAYVLFQGMASGHASLGTMHSNSIEDLISRLQTPPINLPPSLIKVLDLIVIQSLTPLRGKSARRTKEIIEIHDVDMETDKPNVNKVYRWDPRADEFYFSEVSFKVNEISERTGISSKVLQEELHRRTDVLRWMIKNNTTDFLSVSKIIADYYQDREGVMKRVNLSNMAKIKKDNLKGPYEELSPPANESPPADDNQKIA